MTDKIFLRKKVLAKRDELANKGEKSQIICETVLKSNFFKKAKTVFVFLSFGSEVDTSLILKTCFKQGKKVCVPVCKKDCMMDAVAIQNTSDMTYDNKYGIAEPKDASNVVDKQDIDLIIVPGSVFDYDLNRMGYGKGYYDRYFVGTTAKRVALAFDVQIQNEPILVGENDVKMHCIVSESQIIGEL